MQWRRGSTGKAAAIGSGRNSEGRGRLRRVVFPTAVALAASASIGLAAWNRLGAAGSGVEATAAPPRPVERPRAIAAPPAGAPPKIRVRPLADAERPALARRSLEEAVRWAQAGDLEQADQYHAEAELILGGNREIRSGLDEMERRYRDARDVARRFATVRAAFEREDFHTALALLYRLPNDMESSRVRRALANGWYDLAVVALRAGRCEEARRHLFEAAATGGSSELDSEARATAARCRTGSVDRLLLARAESLRFRGPDD